MRICLTFALVLLSQPIGAAELTYSGEDAVRLKCATMLSLATRFAGNEGRLSKEDAAKSRAAAAHLLQGLPGNNTDKGRAMQVMADRLMLEKTPARLKEEFRQTLPACARYF